MVCVNVNVTCGFSRDRVVALTRLLCRVTPKVAKLRGCEPNVKVPDYSDGIHHGTRQGDAGEPNGGDLSAVWGEGDSQGES